ncbi:MAG: hypothetical protein RL034_354 [Bacteroidota bacterium]|jgi:hypothetical protein
MKIKIGFLVLLVSVMVSCRTVKKVQGIQEALSKKDTTQLVVVNKIPVVDSAAIVRDIMGKVSQQKINFKTFNAKIKVDYEGAEKKDNYTVYLSMVKDSVILIRVKGTFLGIAAEGLQARVTKDSVVLVQKVGDKSVTKRSIAYLQEVTEIPFDFMSLQDLLIGNPIFFSNNLVSYKSNDNQLLVTMVGDLFKNLINIDNSTQRILFSKLNDVNTHRSRSCDITFGNYQPLAGSWFAADRKISMSEKSKLDIFLDFKEFSINEPVKYSFEIPKNYKKK